jgi:hypothetical protein
MAAKTGFLNESIGGGYPVTNSSEDFGAGPHVTSPQGWGDTRHSAKINTLGSGYDMHKPTIGPKSCGRWSLSDEIYCPARDNTITIGEARDEEHSLGGIFPTEIAAAAAGEVVNLTSLEHLDYKHPRNKYTCEATCRHSCMDG